MGTHNLCFEQKYEKYQIFFYLKNLFLEVKFSIYLKRRVFVKSPHSEKHILSKIPGFYQEEEEEDCVVV